LATAATFGWTAYALRYALTCAARLGAAGLAYGLGRRRCHGLAAIGLLAPGNLAALVFLLTPTDRYGLPLRVTLIPAAVYALWRLRVALGRPGIQNREYRIAC
jgi:hypothetical protein